MIVLRLDLKEDIVDWRPFNYLKTLVLNPELSTRKDYVKPLQSTLNLIEVFKGRQDVMKHYSVLEKGGSREVAPIRK